MVSLKQLEKEISKINDRNRRVESDKAWETSMMRKFLIAGLTYLTVVSFFLAAGLPKPFANAFVPSVVFILSTMTLPLAKKMWLNKR